MIVIDNQMTKKNYHVWQTSSHGRFSMRIDEAWYCDSFASHSEAKDWALSCREIDGNDHGVYHDSDDSRKGLYTDSEGWGYLADEDKHGDPDDAGELLDRRDQVGGDPDDAGGKKSGESSHDRIY